MEAIREVFWNAELDWDMNTVSNIRILEDHGSSRLLLKEHKTTSAATLRNDVVVRSAYEIYHNYIWCYSVSDKSVPERSGWRRGHLVLSALRIEQIDDKWCEAKFVFCFDFGGWIHVKFMEDEQKRVGQRLGRIKKKVEDDARVAATKHMYAPQQVPQQVYQQPVQQQPVQSIDESKYRAVSKICPLCRNVGVNVFCGNDGTRLELVCENCLSPVTGNNFCGGCGQKLV